jgi:hypothetical protein
VERALPTLDSQRKSKSVRKGMLRRVGKGLHSGRPSYGHRIGWERTTNNECAAFRT